MSSFRFFVHVNTSGDGKVADAGLEDGVAATVDVDDGVDVVESVVGSFVSSPNQRSMSFSSGKRNSS